MLMKRGLGHWKTQYRVYADPSRACNPDGTISVYGNNITDVDCFLIDQNNAKIPSFVVAGDRVQDPSVVCDMSTLRVVVDDPGGGNARMVEPDGTKITMAHFLKNMGKYCNNLGIDPDTNMLGQFKNCTFRTQVHILELEVGQTLEEGHLLMTAMNYHSRQDEARNVNILFTVQGASVTTDASPPGVPVDLFVQAQSESDKKLHNYTIGVEATKRVFSETGQQTLAEAMEQVARGRGPEVGLGPDHSEMPKTCSVMHVQVPCKRKPLKPAFMPPAALVAAASNQVLTMDGNGPVLGVPVNDDYDMEDDNEMGDIQYRSLSTQHKTVRKECFARTVPPAETCRAASTHAGRDMGVSSPLKQTDLQPDDGGMAGIPTVTFSIFMVKNKSMPFGTDDVENAVKLAEKTRQCAGEVHARNHELMKTTGATTDGISQTTAIEIAQTVKALHKARKTNIPVGVVF